MPSGVLPTRQLVSLGVPIADYEPGWAIPAIEHDWPSIMKDAVDRAAANMKKASESYSIRQPITWSTGISEQQWLDAVENYAMPMRIMVGIDEATFNERSKPVGLTNDYKYTDEDGDLIEVRASLTARSSRRAAMAPMSAKTMPSRWR